MKTITKISGVALMLILVFSSCSKSKKFEPEQKAKAEVFDVDLTVKAGETITYQVPVGDADDVNLILTNSTLATTSVLENSTYTYTAPISNSSDFKDLVVIGSFDDDGRTYGGGHCGTTNPKDVNIHKTDAYARVINLHLTVKTSSSNK
jgi:hypothetical protein